MVSMKALPFGPLMKSGPCTRIRGGGRLEQVHRAWEIFGHGTDSSTDPCGCIRGTATQSSYWPGSYRLIHISRCDCTSRRHLGTGGRLFSSGNLLSPDGRLLDSALILVLLFLIGSFLSPIEPPVRPAFSPDPFMPLSSRPLPPPPLVHAFPAVGAGQQAISIGATWRSLWPCEAWLLAECWRSDPPLSV